MLNIEMYGFNYRIKGRVLSCDIFFEAQEIIRESMKEIGLEKEAVITVVYSKVSPCNKTTQDAPFIRICSTGGIEEINRIISVLKKNKIGKLGIDCEKLPLPPNGFIEAKDMC